jgi:hypothetical protein
MAVGRELDPIVVSDDGHVARYAHAHRLKDLGRTRGDLIVATEQCVYLRMCGDEMSGSMPAPTLRPLAKQRLAACQDEAMIGKGCAYAGHPVAGGPEAFWACDVPDMPPLLGDEVLNREPGAAFVIGE